MTSPTTTPSRPALNTSLMVVTDAALTELDPVWQLNLSDIPGVLMDVLPGLVDKWGTAAASTAADWYDHLRNTSGVKGNFTAIVPPLDHLGPEALAGWGSEPAKTAAQDAPVNVDAPRSGLIFTDAAPQESSLQMVQTARSRVEGGVQKRLVNAANLTVTTSAGEDPQSRGWMRRTRPGACKFCVMVASRGGVFTKATATFACHEHCYCEAVPAWGGQALPVGPYKKSDKPSTAADRARVRKWIADNLDGTAKPEQRTDTQVAKPKESKRDIAARQLPGLERSLKNLRAQGLSESSSQVQYHLKQIARLKADLAKAA